MITFAMPKGRILDDAIQLLIDAGYNIPRDLEDSRKLIIDIPEEEFRFILAKPMDVVTYVEHGVADVGIAGKDVMLEEQRDVYELLDLNISPCYLAEAGVPGSTWDEVSPKIATKYPNVASNFYRQKGMQVEIVKLNGSIELAPLIGLVDRIVDIVSTGRTLKENGLVEFDKLVSITSRLIVNPVSYRLKEKKINELVERLAKR
ncbi:ATP phosphoribosyltransferase [Bacillus sp. FJAT-45066]|uniref:ATP phosphoribosyltransferase n=1 Tax=Bacillus sp. FJAT-45066 TaxID=2011010 RepID=UPI000BB8A39D|nr:ATP phosphoribosyltransferase [Bacillus sp. FJAT-45066]